VSGMDTDPDRFTIDIERLDTPRWPEFLAGGKDYDWKSLTLAITVQPDGNIDVSAVVPELEP
jgi:hypothetical protein